MGTRAAHSLLDVLAEETWDLCWSFLSRLELHQITLVCRQFRRIGQARLFRSIRIHHIEFEAARYNGAGFRREHILFARQIECTNALAASAHAASMRELSFADPKNLRGIEPALNEQQTELVRVLVDTLCCYSNLGTLSLCGLDMDAALCESLLSLTRLKILSLSCCDPAFPTLAGRTVLSLTSLSITYRREHGWLARELALTDPNALKHLSIECEEGGTGSVPPLCSTSPPCLPALLSLSLSHVDWPPAQVRRLLELCPHLQKLTIDIDSDNAEAYSNVLETMLPTTIPELKILGCRTDLVPALVRGRPVVDVMILLNQQTLFPPGTAAESEARFDITQVLVAVRAMSLATSTSVRRLSIEHALPLKEEPLVELFAALRQHAPALEFLSLDLLDFGRNLRWSSTEGGPEGITELLTRVLPTNLLSLPRTLTSLRFNCFQPFCQITVHEEHSALIELEACMPSLRVVSICDCHAKSRGEEETESWSWVRDHDVWSKRIAADADVRPGEVQWAETLVSRVWREDGTRKDGKCIDIV